MNKQITNNQKSSRFIAVLLLLVFILSASSCRAKRGNSYIGSSGGSFGSSTQAETASQTETTVETVTGETQQEETTGAVDDTTPNTEEQTTENEPLSTLIPAQATAEGFLDAYYNAILCCQEKDRTEYEKALNALEVYISDKNSAVFTRECELVKEAIQANQPQEIIISEELSAVLAQNNIVEQKITAQSTKQAERKAEMLASIDNWLKYLSSAALIKTILNFEKQIFEHDCLLAYAAINDALLYLPQEELDYFNEHYMPQLPSLNIQENVWQNNEQLLHVQIDNLTAVRNDCAQRLADLLDNNESVRLNPETTNGN